MTKMPGKNRPVLIATLLMAAGVQTGCSEESSARGAEVSSRDQALTALSPSLAEVKGTAQKQLSDWLSGIPAGAEEDFGFNDREEFAQASVSDPYEVYSLEADGTLKPLVNWMVPVVVEGEYRAVLYIQTSGRGYAVVGIGAAGLATDLGTAERGLGTSAQAARSKVLVRAFKQNADFVVYGEKAPQAQNINQLRMHPLTSARNAFAEKAEHAPSKKAGAASLTVAEARTLLKE